MKAGFHSDLPILVVEKWHDLGYSVHLLNCPSTLPPFAMGNLTDESFQWPTELLVSTPIYTLPEGSSQQYTALRSCGKGPVVLDMISYRFEDSIDLVSLTHWEQLRPDVTCHRIPDKGFLLPRRTAAGRNVCLGISNSESQSQALDPEDFGPDFLYFLRMPDRFRQEPAWVRLMLPDSIELGDMEGQEVLAFDDVYGTLLLDDSMGHYCVIQY